MHSWWPLVTQIYCFSSEKNVRTQCHRYPPVMAAHNYQAHCTLWNHFTFDSHRNHVLSESGVITCIIQVRTLSGREGKWFAWGHTTGEWLRWILTQGCDATPTLLVLTLPILTVFRSSTSSLVCTQHFPSSITAGTEMALLPLWPQTQFCSLVISCPHPFPCSSLLQLPFISFCFGQFTFPLLRSILLSFWSRQLVGWHSSMLLYIVGKWHWGDKGRTGNWSPWRADEPWFQKQCYLYYLSLGTDIFGEL